MKYSVVDRNTHSLLRGSAAADSTKTFLLIGFALFLLYPSFTSVLICKVSNSLLRFIPMIAGLLLILIALRHGGLKWTFTWDNWTKSWLFFGALILFRNQDIINVSNLGPTGMLLLSLFLFMFLTSETVWIETFLKAFFISMTVHIVVTVLSYFFPSLFDATVAKFVPQLQLAYERGYMHGLWENRGCNAYAICNAMTVLIGMMCSTKQKKYFALVAFSFFPLLLTAKRGPLLFIWGTLIIMQLLMSGSNAERGKKLLLWLMLSVIIVAVLNAAFPQTAIVWDRFLDADDGDFTNGRFALYRFAVDCFLKDPLFGIGWGKFKYLYASANEIVYTRAGGFNTHNIYLQLLCETGVIGFFVFLIIAYNTFQKTFRLIQEQQNGPQDQNYINYLTISLTYQIFFLMYGLTGNVIYDGTLIVPYVLCCAITYAIHGQSAKNRSICSDTASKYIKGQRKIARRLY